MSTKRELDSHLGRILHSVFNSEFCYKLAFSAANSEFPREHLDGIFEFLWESSVKDYTPHKNFRNGLGNKMYQSPFYVQILSFLYDMADYNGDFVKAYFLWKFRERLSKLIFSQSGREHATRTELTRLLKLALYIAYGTNIRYFSDLDSDTDKGEKHEEQGMYYYIPLHIRSFLDRVIFPLKKYSEDGWQFLDVGSGIGDKSLLAWLCGICDFASGVEYSGFTSKISANLARSLKPHYVMFGSEEKRPYNYKNHPLNFFHGDAFEFKNYGQFDVVYFYHPIEDDENMHKLYEHVFSEIRTGTIMIETLRYKESWGELIWSKTGGKRLKNSYETCQIKAIRKTGKNRLKIIERNR